MQVDWYLTDNSDQYQVIDVAIGGMNMKVALREQFASKIENIGDRVNASWLVT